MRLKVPNIQKAEVMAIASELMELGALSRFQQRAVRGRARMSMRRGPP